MVIIVKQKKIHLLESFGVRVNLWVLGVNMSLGVKIQKNMERFTPDSGKNSPLSI